LQGFAQQDPDHLGDGAVLRRRDLFQGGLKVRAEAQRGGC
jgi:hypothetical protein